MAKRGKKNSKRRRKEARRAQRSRTAVAVRKSALGKQSVNGSARIFVPQPALQFNPADWTGPEGDIGRFVVDETAKILGAYAVDPDGLDEDAQAEQFSFRGGYAKRQLVELVQNSADALKYKGGRIEIRVTDDFLYCADGGIPITKAGVRSLMRAHLSSKQGTDFIGQFGLGFKSVLAITDAPEFFSRSGSFLFDRGRAEKRIRQRIAGDHPCPVLRLPEPINAIEQSERDNVLREMMAWATNIVRLPLKSDAYPSLQPQIDEFQPECLFFMQGVNRLVLIDELDDWSVDYSIREHGQDILLVSKGSEVEASEQSWRVFARRVSLSQAARDDYQTDIADNDQIDVSWAVPLAQLNAPGDFWAYFPTTESCLVAGVLNSRWKTNEDRQSLLEGPYNDELTAVAADVIAGNLHDLSNAHDPALHLDALPRRVEAGDDLYAAQLRDDIFRRLHQQSVLPDLNGDLQHHKAIRHPPILGNNEETRLAYQSWINSNTTASDWLHPAALRTRERIGAVERLCDEYGRPPNQGGSGAPRASIAEWLEVLVDEVSGDEEVEASKTAIRIAAGLPSHSGIFERRNYGKIILTNEGYFASVAEWLYLPTEDDEDWDGHVAVHPELADDQSTRAALKKLGVQEASAEIKFDSSLNAHFWGERQWRLSRGLDLGTAASSITRRRDWRSKLCLKTINGEWHPLHSVLLPNAIVPSDGSRDGKIAVDMSFHQVDEMLINRLGVSDRPSDGWDLTSEPDFNRFRIDCRERYQELAFNQTGSTPQVGLIKVRDAKGVGPLTVFSLLSEEGKARFTDALISDTSTFEPWIMEHKTQSKYGTMPVPQLAISALKEHGRIQTSAGIVPFTDALGENPSSPEAQRVLLDHPNAALIREEFGLQDARSVHAAVAEPVEPILEVWPRLEDFLKPEQTSLGVSRCQWFEDEYGLRVDERSALIDNVIYLPRMDDIDELRETCTILGVSLGEEELYTVLDQPTPREIEDARNDVANQSDDARRLLKAVGASAIRSELPDSLIAYYERNGTGMSGIELADAAIATFHTGALKQYLRFLKHLNPPKRWTSGPKTVDFVRSLGFSKEWAGDPRSSLDPFIDVPGPFNLHKAHKYQRTIIDELRDVLASSPFANANRRALISLPTGSGKTRVAVQGIVEAMREDGFNGGVLWVADREELCEQAIESWQQVWSAIGSERKTLRVSRMWGNQPRPSSNSEFHVVVATIQTLLSRFVKRSYGYEFLRDFTMVVFDEAHRSTAPSFSAVMRDIGFSRPQRPTDPFLLGLTATPYRGRDQAETKRLVDTYGNNRLDRDAFPTNNADDVVRELQRMNVLAYAEHDEIIGSEFELSEEERLQALRTPWLSPNTEIRIARDAERTERIVKAYKEHIASQPETWPTLIFATSVEHAQTLAAILSADGISARAVSGGTDRYTRRQVVEQFRAGKLNVLVNYGVFREGFDAPKTRAIIVARPVYSPNLYFQMIGRGLRGVKNGGNERCLILDVNDNIVNFERNLAFTELDWLWD